jgi:hypothetical protein
MDAMCLDYCLTDQERQAFEKNGFFIVPHALPASLVAELIAVSDRVMVQYRQENDIPPENSVNLLDFLGRDEAYLELIDWSKTFPKVWGILGWNIQVYHSHMIYTPPLPAEERELLRSGAKPKGRGILHWHQDSGRLNVELDSDPRPRVSLKVAFFLSDTSEIGRGNFRVIPGSHLKNKIAVPEDGSDPAGVVYVQAAPGDAVFFDRRIWHSASPNYSDITRKVLFYGYSYRWLRPRDDMTAQRWIDRCNPIRQQLLGKSTGGHGYTSPGDTDVPLRSWIAEHLGAEAVAP